MSNDLNPGKIYRETVGKPHLRSAWQTLLWEKWDSAEAAGRLTGGYKKLLKACLLAAGADFDNDPAHNEDGWTGKTTR